MSKKIAIIGTQGVPARYGGFETLVENIISQLSANFCVTIFCSSKDLDTRMENYKGAKLKYLPLSANGIESVIFDILSILISLLRSDRILILGSSGCIILPLLVFWRKKFVINIGGLDWKRSKWSKLAQTYLKISESFGIRYSNIVISDNKGIANYIKSEYKRDSFLIPYGSDHVLIDDNIEKDNLLENKYSYIPKNYFCTVARIQEDNNIEMILESFKNVNENVVIVGNWNNSEYGKSLKSTYKNQRNIYLLDAIYDVYELNFIRSNCFAYIHGHSAGGTNPALIEAMQLRLVILCYSNQFNEYTTGFKAKYFSSKSDLTRLLKNIKTFDLENIKDDMKTIAETKYIWQKIADQYCSVFRGKL